ncbi:MAG: IgA Peptidase M64 [Gemmatimonadota bacterium]|nr:MAG: IgA Peptidase M64 [Gemmatimonadota bacterium]
MTARIPATAGPFVLLAAALVGFAAVAGDDPEFDRYFTDKTMRVDYYHTGDATHEVLSLERVVSDGPWAGPRMNLIDDTNFGKYFYEVYDLDSGALLFTRGFATIYGEWETTGEARTTHRTFHESVRFPWPKGPVKVVVKKRDDLTTFHLIGEFEIDPESRSVNPADPPSLGNVWTLFEHGPPSDKVDIVLLGEGYTAEETEKFHADARRLAEELFSWEPFKSRRSDFNIRAIDLPAAQSGVTRAHSERYRRNLVGTQYGIFDSERYMLTYDNRTLRDVLSAAPYDFMGILVNEKQYGGGGIYRTQMATAVDSDFSDYIFVHEFGHHFAGLADEYYTSDVAYETGAVEQPEPWEANVTALHDPAALKWADLVEPGTPIPTPWAKLAFEEHSQQIRARRAQLIEQQAPESEFDALFHEQREIEARMLATQEYSTAVGAFEGAMYEPTGLYRSSIDCIMFTRDEVGFCRVCRRAIERVIDLYAGR